jgi:hypothetical protein
MTRSYCAWPPAQQLLGIASERRWIRYARSHLTGLFPRLPGQSGYGKRLRASGGLLSAVITELARDTASWHDLLRMVDSSPLPYAASRETVRRSDNAAALAACVSIAPPPPGQVRGGRADVSRAYRRARDHPVAVCCHR